MTSEDRQRNSQFPTIWIAVIAALAVLVRIFFWMYTHRTWEDALITVLHSENAASGLGLTHYRVGEGRIHGFTSPISVLVPLIGDLIHVGFGLTLIKISSAVAAAWAVFFGALVARDLGLSKPLIVFVAGYLAFEHHQILWGMAGMETELVVAIILFSIWSLLNFRPVRTGIGLGLCMLVRPDLAMWLGIAGLFLLYRAAKERNFKPVAVTIAVAALIYAPWIIFATVYYGSPIPNTIIAKSAGYHLWITSYPGVRAFLGHAKIVFMDALSPLGPSFGGNGTGFIRLAGGYPIEKVMVFLLAAGLAVSLWRRDVRAIPTFSFIVVYSAYYTFLVPHVFGWYCVPLTAVVVIGCAYGLSSLIDFLPQRWRWGVGAASAAIYLAAIVMVLPTTFRGERNIQTYIEDGVRKQIGLYLHGVTQRDSTIGCEPLGYIAYYSRRTVYDYPGLCSRRVAQFLKNNPDKRHLDAMLEHFRPDYIVLRNFEYATYSADPADAWVNHDYMLVREFQVSPDDIAKLLFSKRNLDLHYMVFKKN